MLEESLLEDMHPFAARFATPPVQKDKSTNNPEGAPKSLENANISAHSSDSSQSPALQENEPKKTQQAGHNQKSSQSVDQSVSQLTNQSTEEPSGTVVPRPKAFYITERLDKRLDKAVRYLQDAHGIKKVDRSTILNTMLDRADLFTTESLDELVDRVVSQLTSRLTG